MPKSTPDDLEAVRNVVAALSGFNAEDQERILRWAREKLGLTAAAAPVRVTPPAAAAAAANPPDTSSDISSFMNNKQPRSNVQFAAAVAYYYKFEAPELERKESINAQDLQDACRKAPRDRLKKPAQTLVNAYHQGLLDKADRGSYQINSVGENLVAMALPEGNAVEKPKQGKKKRGKVTSRKRKTK